VRNVFFIVKEVLCVLCVSAVNYPG
jgi:hypothetical protein